MVVQQEMAAIYPPDAEELAELLPEVDCGSCGFGSCMEFAEALLAQQAEPAACPELDREFNDVLLAVLGLNKDPIPYNIMMEQEPCALIEINRPDRKSPLLVTGNFRETVRVMTEILQKTGTRAFLLATFTHGYSVDNAVHERMFKATEIWKALKENAVAEKVDNTVMVIPGLADKERNAIRQMTGWNVLVGPASGFLAPLFLLRNRQALA